VYARKRKRAEGEETCAVAKRAHMRTQLQRVADRLSVLGDEPPSVDIGESTLPGAGLGLFAERKFAANEPITAYTGQLIPYQLARQRNPSHIRSLIAMTWAIDGSRTEEGQTISDPLVQRIGYGVAAFANDNLQHPEQTNAAFDFQDSDRNCDPFHLSPHERIVFLRATRPIRAGQEIFVHYGSDYWTRARSTRQKKPKRTR
jgi:hypothetical protein